VLLLGAGTLLGRLPDGGRATVAPSVETAA